MFAIVGAAAGGDQSDFVTAAVFLGIALGAWLAGLRLLTRIGGMNAVSTQAS